MKPRFPTARHLRWAAPISMALFLGFACNDADEIDDLGDDASEDDTQALTASNGLVGEYFDNVDFTNKKLTRTDANVNFNWNSSAPASGMGSNTFSIRWTGKVMPQYSETYRFYVYSDDKAKLWVNGQLVVSDTSNGGNSEKSGTIALQAGQKYDIKLEYSDNSGTATVRLRWSSASRSKVTIPSSALFTGADTEEPPTDPEDPPTDPGDPTTPPPSGSGPSIAGCPMFPADNPWNQDISTAAVDSRSAAYINYIMANGADYMHPDFGSYAGYGIPYVVVPGTQTKVPMTFDYDEESDPGPYPIPQNAPIENGANSTGDRHILVVDKDNCKLYETWDTHYVGPGWHAGAGAIFDLTSNALRPAGWTSADAAGLPILPGLVRYEEAVTAGEIKHALRFTVAKTQRAYVHPARHWASTITDPNAPPMGLRLRLKASYDISGYTGASRVILTALKKYGMILADNGSNWFVSGTSNPSFDDNNLNQLKNVPGTAFEVVASGPITKP
ncbi:MAG: hypothetical protein HOW73_15240 [Polyangiaceae bacterium]|nr:hypothetical protein [Polyangiaceae bacterium]